MANTYMLIGSTTLASSSSSVLLGSISQAYTDLLVRASVRTDISAIQDNLSISDNGSGTTLTAIRLQLNGSTVTSSQSANLTFLDFSYINGNTSTASTFSDIEVYIPNYTSTNTTKQSYCFGVAGNNATNGYIASNAGLSTRNTAIDSLTFRMVGGSNILSGSSFYIYGIKKD
jgi:hypothetical protein